MSRLRNIPEAKDAVLNSKWVIHEPKENKGKFSQLFENKGNPLNIEIGMGKGRFIMDLAEQNPEINYIGIERYDSVLFRALQKMEDRQLTNLLFLSIDAAEVDEIFEKGEVSKIYLNFSDPWPKDRHAKRRLTSNNFLEKYDKFLKNEGTIEFKTDNKDLFDFSLEEVNNSKWEIVKYTRDLHNDSLMNAGNIMTEYEEKFSLRGNPIFKYIIRR